MMRGHGYGHRVLAFLSTVLAVLTLALLPGGAQAATLPQSCADVKAQNPGAADGAYTLLLQGRTARIYCADMAGTPKEYITLARTGGNYNYAFFYGNHKNHYYQYWWVYGVNALTHYNKIRIDPVSLVVDQNDKGFAVLTSVGKNGYDSSDPNFNPVPQSMAYATGGDCAASWSSQGRANVDLTGTDFALADATTFAWGGFAANGSVSVDPGRQIVNMTGGGWCGGVGPQGPLKLKLLTPLAPTDTTPPVTTAAVPTGWQNHDVTITLIATDAESGVAATFYQVDGASQQQGTTVTVSADGTHSLAFWSVDKEGNTEAPHTAVIHVDKTAPTISGSASTTAWTNQPVTVSFACSDATSGVASCPDAVTLTSEGANQAVSGTAVDAAGNTASAAVSGINIDLTAPTITAQADRAANAAGWYNGAVTIGFACGDSLSGIAACSGPAILTQEGAGQSAAGQAADKAGNTASAAVSGINIDLTAPVVAYTGNAGTYTVDQQVQIACAATDALSGIAESSCQPVTGPAYTFALGTNSFSATAVDKAGNAQTGTAVFTVSLSYGSLCSLTRQFVTQDGIAKALCAKLDAAKESAARGSTTSKAGQIGAYINQVQAQTGKALTPEQAAILTRLAQAL